MSPYQNSPTPFIAMGEGFGTTSFAIREVRVHDTGRDVWLIATSEKEVKAVSLVNGTTYAVARAPDAGRLSNVHEYTTVDAWEDQVCFLFERGGAVYLGAVASDGAHMGEAKLPSEQVAGPFRQGETIYVYSERELIGVSGDIVRRHPFPRGFAAWVRSAHDRAMQTPPGRTPFSVTGSSVYIPGSYAGQSAFLVQHLRGSVESTIVQIPGEVTYRPALRGQIVLSAPGKISVLSGSTIREVAADLQIGGRRAAFATDSVWAAFVDTAGGERLRICIDDQNRDHPVQSFARFQECFDFCSTGSAFVMTYLTTETQLGVSIWRS